MGAAAREVGSRETRVLAHLAREHRVTANERLLRRRNENGQWEVRYIPPEKSGWPPVKPSPIFVQIGMKASICFKCGHVKLIKADDEHKACMLRGGKMDSE